MFNFDGGEINSPRELDQVQQEAIRFFQVAPYFLDECGPDIAVNNTVVKGDCNVHHFADNDLAIADNGAIDDVVHTENGYFGMVNDGGCQEATQLAK